MNKIKNSGFFRIISLILILTFISLDIAYAYPSEHNADNSTLGAPSVFQNKPINDTVALSQGSVMTQSATLSSIYYISEHYFGTLGGEAKEYVEGVMRTRQNELLTKAGIKIVTIVPVDYLKKNYPEKLQSSLSEIGFKGALPNEGVIFVLYKKGDKRFLIQIAEKSKVSAANLPGYDWNVSDKYLVKYISENYEASKNEKLTTPPVETKEPLTTAVDILNRYYGITDIRYSEILSGGHGSEFKPILVEASIDGQMRKVVLRRVSSKRSLDAIRFTVSVINKLHGEGLPVPKLYEKTADRTTGADNYIVNADGAYYLLEEYISKGKAVRVKDAGPKEEAALGALAARVNNALTNFSPEGDKRYLSREAIFEKTWKSIKDYHESLSAIPVTEHTEVQKLFADNFDLFNTQAAAFTSNYTKDLQAHLVSSIIHNDLHCGNVKFDDAGNIVALIDFDLAMSDYRISEFNNLVLGRDDILDRFPYNLGKLSNMIMAYQNETSEKLNEQEIRGIIEVLRTRLLEVIAQKFVRPTPADASQRLEQIQQANLAIETFKAFAADLTDPAKIDKFLVALNEKKQVRSDPIKTYNSGQVILPGLFLASGASIAALPWLRDFTIIPAMISGTTVFGICAAVLFSFVVFVVSVRLIRKRLYTPTVMKDPIAEFENVSAIIRQETQALEYDKQTADALIAMVHRWVDPDGKPAFGVWKSQIDMVRKDVKRGIRSADELDRFEYEVMGRISEALMEEIQGKDDGASDLDEILRRKEALCLGFAQLTLVLARSIGISASMIDVLDIRDRDHMVFDKGHAAGLFNLSSGKTVMIDLMAGQRFFSKPFYIDEEFEKQGIYLIQRTSPDALNIHRKIRILDQNVAKAYIHQNRGVKYGKDVNRSKEAISEYSKSIALDPFIHYAYVSRAAEYNKLNQYDKAIEDCDRALEIYPQCAQAYSNRAVARIGKGDYDRGIADCDKALEVDPQCTTAYYIRGLMWCRKGDYKQGINDFDKAIEIDPLYSEAFENRGNAYGELGDDFRAIADYTRAIELAPQTATSYRNRATSYIKTHQYNKAVLDDTKAVELDPTMEDRAAKYVDRVGLDTDNDKSAISGYGKEVDDLTAAIAKEPARAELYNLRGINYAKLGEAGKALADIAKAIEIDPRNAQFYSNLGSVYFDLRQYAKAIDECNKAIALDPKYYDAYLYRAIARASMGSAVEAGKDLITAMKIDPSKEAEIKAIAKKFDINIDIIRYLSINFIPAFIGMSMPSPESEAIWDFLGEYFIYILFAAPVLFIILRHLSIMLWHAFIAFRYAATSINHKFFSISWHLFYVVHYGTIYYQENHVDALVKIGSAAVPALIKTLGEYRNRAQGVAASALGEIKDPRAVEPLIELLGSHYDDVAYFAIFALGKIGSPAVEPLLKALDHSNWAVRYNAAKALSNTGDPRAVEPLIKLLSSNDGGAAINAAKALGNVKDPRVVEALIKAMRNNMGHIGSTVAEAFGKIKDPRAVEPLIELLDSNRNDKTAEALGKIKDPRAVEPLIRSLRKSKNSGEGIDLSDKASYDRRVDSYIIKALIEIGLPSVAPLINALKDSNSYVRSCAAEALSEIKDPRAVEPLIKLLTDDIAEIRISAAEALGRIKDPRAVEPLIETLDDDNSNVRSSAILALSEIKDPRAVEPLIKLLNDDIATIRISAAEALGWIKDPRAVEPLIKALRDDYSHSGSYAVKALGQIGPVTPDVVPALKEALKNREVGDAAAKVLGEFKKNSKRSSKGSQAGASVKMLSIDPFATTFFIVLLVPCMAAFFIIRYVISSVDWHMFWIRHGIAVDKHMDALAKRGADAVPVLIDMLGDNRRGGMAVKTLIKIGEPAVPALKEALVNTRGSYVRYNAAEALNAMGKLTPELKNQRYLVDLRDDMAAIRINAVRDIDNNHLITLGIIISLAEALLREEDDYVRGYIAQLLGDIALMGSSEIADVGNAKLSEIVDSLIVPALKKVLLKKMPRDSYAKNRAVEALDKIGKLAVAPLPDVVKEKSAGKPSKLFDLIESAAVSRRAGAIEIGKKIIDSVSSIEDRKDIGLIDKDMASAEIIGRIKRAIEIIDSLDKEDITPEIRASIDSFRNSLYQFEVDGSMISFIALALKSKEERQKLIIALETDWIPGMTVKNSFQQKAINSLMKEISRIGDRLKDMGLDNVRVIRGSGDQLAEAIIEVSNDTENGKYQRTNMRNIVVIASKKTIEISEAFKPFREANEKDKPFLTGIDSTELIKLYEKYGELTADQFQVELTTIICMSMEVASGKEPPQAPWIHYDSANRTLSLKLGAIKPVDYGKMKNSYDAQAAALRAA